MVRGCGNRAREGPRTHHIYVHVHNELTKRTISSLLVSTMFAINSVTYHTHRLSAAQVSHANVVLVTFRLHVARPFQTVESA